MNDVTVTRRLDAARLASVRSLLAAVAERDGFWPLSDQLVSDLDHPHPDHPHHDERRPICVLGGPADALWGYAQASRRAGGWTIQVVTIHDGDAPSRERTLADVAVRAVDEAGGGEIDWWVYQPGTASDDTAAAVGFSFDRDLLQMRRDLPADRPSSVETRSFVVGRDEAAWLAVNNRAFAGHAEQGGWTIETVRQRVDQPWFDPDGLRLHDRDGRLAAFCWTKIHETPVRTGEIYVIGVDPDCQGLGLGRELTLAGLDHMVGIGIGHAMLYVDGANESARTLYDKLGFEVTRTDRAYRRTGREAPKGGPVG